MSDNDEPGHVHTRDTIRRETGEEGTTSAVMGGAGVYPEFGTSRMAAHPVLTPAAMGTQSQEGEKIADEAFNGQAE